MARIRATTANDSVYVVSGVQLTADNDGKPRRILPFLVEADRFSPADSDGSKSARLPRGTAAAPSPALVHGNSVVLLGGVDGSLFDVEQSKHPGFPREVLHYDAEANAWSKLAAMPQGASRVTAPTVRWRGGWIVASGESRPGVRSAKVFLGQVCRHEIGSAIMRGAELERFNFNRLGQYRLPSRAVLSRRWP